MFTPLIHLNITLIDIYIVGNHYIEYIPSKGIPEMITLTFAIKLK